MKSKKQPIRKSSRTTRGPQAAGLRRKAAEAAPIILDFVLNRITFYNNACGGGVCVRKDSRGYTLYLEEDDSPIARLKPRDGAADYEILYWSPFHRRWRRVGPAGESALPLDEALDFIANDPLDCFWY